MSLIDFDRLTDHFRGREQLGHGMEPWVDAPPGGWEVDLIWTEIEGRSEYVGFVLVGDGSEPLTASILRKLPIGTLINDSRKRQLQFQISQYGPDWHEMQRQALEKWEREGRQGPRPILTPDEDPIGLEHQRRSIQRLTEPRRRYDPEHYERVAQIYDEAIAAGIPPTAHVQEQLGLRTRTQAAKQVARARKAGLLPPTEQRVAKGNS